MCRDSAASKSRASSSMDRGRPLGGRARFCSVVSIAKMCGTSLTSCHLRARLSAARPTESTRSMPPKPVPRAAIQSWKRRCSRGVIAATVRPSQNSCHSARQSRCVSALGSAEA